MSGRSGFSYVKVIDTGFIRHAGCDKSSGVQAVSQAVEAASGDFGMAGPDPVEEVAFYGRAKKGRRDIREKRCGNACKLGGAVCGEPVL